MNEIKIVKTSEAKLPSKIPATDTMYAVNVVFTGASLLYIDENGQVKATQDLSFIRGYDASQTQTLKQVNGVLQWVNG